MLAPSFARASAMEDEPQERSRFPANSFPRRRPHSLLVGHSFCTQHRAPKNKVSFRVHLQDVNVLRLFCVAPHVATCPRTHLARSHFPLPTLSSSSARLPTSLTCLLSTQHSLASAQHVKPRTRFTQHCPLSALPTPWERCQMLRNQLS